MRHFPKKKSHAYVFVLFINELCINFEKKEEKEETSRKRKNSETKEEENENPTTSKAALQQTKVKVSNSSQFTFKHKTANKKIKKQNNNQKDSIVTRSKSSQIKTIEIKDNDTNPIRYEYDSFSYLLHENKKV